jgi:hypothetical protein
MEMALVTPRRTGHLPLAFSVSQENNIQHPDGGHVLIDLGGAAWRCKVSM